LLLAGRPVDVRIAGGELARSTLRPFDHLRCEHELDPELTIELWDGAATGIPLPFAELTVRDVRVASDVVTYADRGSVTELDQAGGRITGWRAAAGSLSPEEQLKPLPVVLPLFLLGRGVCEVHAGLVAANGLGALFAGAARAGKSTAALASAAAGFSFLADDRVGLEEVDGSFTGHSLYASAWLSDDHLRRHPQLRCGQEAHRTVRKTMLFLKASRRTAVARAAPIRVILLPTGGRAARPRLVAATATDAFRALAPMSVLGVSSIAADWMLDRLARLARAVPVLRMESGADPAAIPRLVEEALARFS
jgi:hypothetical protein